MDDHSKIEVALVVLFSRYTQLTYLWPIKKH